MRDPRGLVVIGASWGGLHAVGRLLTTLPASMTLPVLVVQHRAKDGTSLLAALLQDVTRRSVRDAEHGEAITAGTVRIAPPDRHLLVVGERLELSSGRPVRFSRPSIDVTFASAADAADRWPIAVVLTGANNDGARGARQIVDAGGHVLVQDPTTAEVRTMPDAALRQLRSAPPESWSVAGLDVLAELVAVLAARLDGDAAPHASTSPAFRRPPRRV